MKHTNNDNLCEACGLLGKDGCLWLPKPIPPRPSIRDESIIKVACQKILPKVLEWLGPECGDEDGVIKDLIEAATSIYDMDGYKIAKELDWFDVSSDLVEILDDISGHAYNAHQQAETVWVKEYDIVSPFAIGDKVSYSKWKSKHFTGDKKQGVVRSIQHERGKCVVRPDNDPSTFGGYIFPYEELEKI